MSLSNYRFRVYNLMSGALAAEVPFTSFTFTEKLSDPGSWSATLPIDHPLSDPAILAVRQSVVYVYQGNLPIFGGILWDREIDNDIKVSGTGLMGYYSLRRLRSRAGMTYADTSVEVATTSVNWAYVDQFRIVSDLMAHAASIAGGGNVAPTSVLYNGVAGGALSGISVSRQVWGYERREILAVINELVKKVNGIEYRVNYDLNTSVSPPRPRWYLNLGYPRLGQAAPALSFDEDNGATVKRYHQNGKDGGTVQTGLGSGSADAKLVSDQIESALIYPAGSYPYLEDVGSYNEVGDQAQLDNLTTGDLRAGRLPVETFSLVVKNKGPQYGDYTLGDQPIVRADRDGLRINGRYRIVQIKATISDLNELSAELSMCTPAASLGSA